MSRLQDLLVSSSAPRLFQTGATTPERQAGMTLLALLPIIPEFAEAILKPFGVRVVKRSKVTSHVDAVLRGHEGRLDGILDVSNTNSSWMALVDLVGGRSGDDVDPALLATARDIGAAAVLRITPEARWVPESWPEADTPRIISISFARIAQVALLMLHSGSVEDDLRRELLGELLRLIGHDGLSLDRLSGLSRTWTKGVQDISRGDPVSAEDLKAMTYDVLSLQDDLGRMMGELLGVKIGLKIRNAADRSADFELLEKQIAMGSCSVSFHIEGLVSPIVLLLDVASREIRFEMSLDAPRDRDARGQIAWLLGMIDSNDSRYAVCGTGEPESAFAAIPIHDLRGNLDIVAKNGVSPRTGFRVIMSVPLGSSFQNRTKIVEDVARLMPDFYEDIAMVLRPWLPTPPPIIGRRPDEATETEKPKKKAPRKTVSEEKPSPQADLGSSAVAVTPSDDLTDAAEILPASPPEAEPEGAEAVTEVAETKGDDISGEDVPERVTEETGEASANAADVAPEEIQAEAEHSESDGAPHGGDEGDADASQGEDDDVQGPIEAGADASDLESEVAEDDEEVEFSEESDIASVEEDVHLDAEDEVMDQADDEAGSDPDEDGEVKSLLDEILEDIDDKKL